MPKTVTLTLIIKNVNDVEAVHIAVNKALWELSREIKPIIDTSTSKGDAWEWKEVDHA